MNRHPGWIFEAKLGSLGPAGTIFSLTDFKLKLKRPSPVTSPPHSTSYLSLFSKYQILKLKLVLPQVPN